MCKVRDIKTCHLVLWAAVFLLVYVTTIFAMCWRCEQQKSEAYKQMAGSWQTLAEIHIGCDLD